MDDPRFENPNDIIDDMLKDTKKTNYLKIISRRDAIEYALKIATSKDIILILGKGSDEYMLIEDKKIPYSDYQVISELESK